MHVLIVGAGICGLSAAVAIRRNGHRVTLFEQSRMAAESGAAIFLPPNANGPLRRYGFVAEDHGANQYRGTLHFTHDGKLTLHESFNGSEFENHWDLIRRSSLHSGIKQLAVDPAGPGAPAELHTANRVVSIDADAATVTLADGTTVAGDVVLGADGSHSVARDCIGARDEAGGLLEPFNSGKNCFRFLIDRARLKAEPQTRVYEVEGSLIAWFSPDVHLVSYPCERNEAINFVAIHPSHLSDATGKDYDSAGSKDLLQRIYADFEPTVQTIMRLVDADAVKLYPLNDMKTMPTYVHGRMALLGDAAHPFLPYLGQGGAQAIEDAMSMGVMLSADATPADVPQRLRLYEQARKERAEKVQNATRMVGSGLAESEPSEFEKLREYNFRHDEIAVSEKLLHEHLASSTAAA